MTLLDRTRRVPRALVSLAAVIVPLVLVSAVIVYTLPASAAGRRARSHSTRPKLGAYNPAHQTVEMFEAIAAGEIRVKFIPKDSRQARVFITNKTKKPLNVKLPEAFAAVPVLAQMGGMGGGGMGGGGMGGGGMGGGGGQGMGGGMGGGGMGGGGMGGGGMGGGGGMFNVRAEKVGNFKVTCICLEHGKVEPRPAIPYEIRPIASFTDKTAVHELCKLLGYGRVSQRVAQAAAWHLCSEMSWEELAAKEIKRLDGTRYPYFSHDELQAAIGIAVAATNLAAEEPPASPGETASKTQ